MSDTKEFTLKEVTAHNTKKDLYLVIHDKVYDCSSFVDEHPCVLPTLPCALSYLAAHSLVFAFRPPTTETTPA